MKAQTILNHLSLLDQLINDIPRYIDIALRFEIVDSVDGKPKKSGEFSPLYGGVYDTWFNEYDFTKEPKAIHTLNVARKTYPFLMDDDSKEIMLKGGRRGAKSETGTLKGIKFMVRMCGCPGGVTSYTFKASDRVWKKFIKKIPTSWLKPGTQGIKKDKREIHLLNNSWVHFGSADHPDSIRGEGDAWHFGDETRNWKKYAVENILFSLSEGGTHWQWFEATTPSRGEVQIRYLQYLENEACEVYSTNALDNPFIDPSFIEHLKKRVDPLFFAQEMGEFISLQGVVYYNFDRAIHQREYSKWNKYDCTQRFTNIKYGKAYDYIIGVDYNISPMCAVVLKLLDGNNLFVIKEITLDTEADSFKMGKKLKELGFINSIIIDDASGEYSRGGRSGSRGFRNLGFRVIHPKKNPRIEDRVASVRAKLMNVDDESTLFIDPVCKKLSEALESQEYDKNGVPEKGTYDHILDALGYVINRLFPIKNDYEKQEIKLRIAA